MTPKEQSIGVRYEIEPLYIVAVQLKTFTAEGIATMKERIEKTIPAKIDCPDTNMWCPHTRKPSTAIPIEAKATNLYPKMFLREKVVTSSDTTPMAGRTMM